MKKVSFVVCFLCLSISIAFADIDVENIPDIITSINHARFRLDRAEATINVYEQYDINVGFSILDTFSSILNNNYVVNGTTLKNGNVIVNNNDKQFFLFPRKIFMGAGMKINGVGLGLGYQFSYRSLTLAELEAVPVIQVGSQPSIDDIIGVIENIIGGVSDRFITTHTLALGMTFLDDTVELNVPFSLTVANNDYYSTSFGPPVNGASKNNPKGNMAFSVLPKVRYSTGGNAFTYIETTIGFGINGGSRKVSDDKYEDGNAVTIFLKTELGLQLMTDPITILVEPDISFGIGFNSSTERINAIDGEAHMAQYIKNNTPVKVEIKLPVKFSSSIGNAISMFGTPILGLSYAQHGASGINEGIGDEVYGVIYGFEAGFEFTPIENLTFGFELQGLGGPQLSLDDDDFVYVLDQSNENGPSFTFGLNASLVWRF